MDKGEFILELLEIATKNGYDPIRTNFVVELQNLVNPIIDDSEKLRWVIQENNELRKQVEVLEGKSRKEIHEKDKVENTEPKECPAGKKELLEMEIKNDEKTNNGREV